MKNKSFKNLMIALVSLLTILIILIIIFTVTSQKSPTTNIDSYNPQINPANFIDTVDNKYFTLTPKTKFVYVAQTEDGLERIEVYVTEEKKTVIGIATTVVWDRVWLNDELIEDTKDWYAQDKEGNVWYFGEESKELVSGKIVSTKGSWQAGVDEAKPGIIMKANPVIGEVYKQEYYKGEAEDMAEIISFGETVRVPYKNFADCLKTKDWTPLEKNSEEEKYYCPEISFVVLEVGLESGERVELISVEKNSQPTPTTLKETDVLKTEITEKEAIEIALEKVPGEATDVAIEKKFGKTVYVIEIQSNNGVETDIIIDIETGEVLGIET